MVRCLKINKELSSGARNFLLQNNFLDKSTVTGKTQRYLFFPLTEDANTKKILSKFKGTIENRNLQRIRRKGPPNLKEALKSIVPAGKAEFLRRSFDVVGDIAVLEIPQELKKLERSIAWNVKRVYPNINVVARRSEKTEGVYRIRKIIPLVGEKRTDTTHKESGLNMRVDLNKVYFSTRMGSERIRISKQVKKNENILIMFAGIGPQALVIAKQNPSALIKTIELNPEAVKLTKENIRINYLGDRVAPLKGDVRRVVPKIKEKFNRIIMILPHENEKYLNLALSVAKKGSTVHMYAFVKAEEFDNLKIRLEKEHKVKVKQLVKAGEYAPYVWRVCADMKVL